FERTVEAIREGAREAGPPGLGVSDERRGQANEQDARSKGNHATGAKSHVFAHKNEKERVRGVAEAWAVPWQRFNRPIRIENELESSKDDLVGHHDCDSLELALRWGPPGQ